MKDFDEWFEKEYSSKLEGSVMLLALKEVAFKAWQAAQKPQWQPIETTPKDKAVLILYDEPSWGSYSKEVEKAYFDSESSEWRFYLSDRKISTHENGIIAWQPLPAPPPSHRVKNDTRQSTKVIRADFFSLNFFVSG